MNDSPHAHCPLCGRPLVDGPSVERHHVVPKSRGGTDVAVLHAVCHRMLHKVFDERTLEDIGDDFERLRAHPDIAKFIRWIRKKPDDFVDYPRTQGRKTYRASRR